MKVYNKPLYEISSHKHNRIDSKYWSINAKIKINNYVLLRDLFEIINGTAQTSNYSVEPTSIPYIRIGDMSYKYDLDLSEVMFLDEDSEINAYKLLREDDIIIATIGSVGKVVLAKKAKGGTFSNNTAVLRCKDKKIDPNFYVLLLQTNFYNNYIFGLVSQKAQPNLQDYDLQNIKLPYICKKVSDLILEKCNPLNYKITDLKQGMHPIKNILEEIISSAFSINIKKLVAIDKQKIFTSSLINLSFNNSNHRFSTRWNKVGLIQEKLLQMSPNLKRLGNYIISTQNGWSPECKDGATVHKVLGVDGITRSTELSFDNIKFSDVSNGNYKNFLVRDNDFLVSRGNTTDLVALAAVAEFDNPEDEFIFPDLMIRVELSSEINKKFLAYIFNSFIGRLYFKYSSKGKNQTMVKISKKELHDFYIPLPSLDEQNQIVTKIKTEIDKQNQIKAEILNLRSQIDKIIEDAITSGV